MDLTEAIKRTLDADWRLIVADVGVEAFVDRCMADDGTPSWMRSALIDAVTEAYERPECERCEDSGVAEEVDGPWSWRVVCGCAASERMDEYEMTMIERAAQRAAAFSWGRREA